MFFINAVHAQAHQFGPGTVAGLLTRTCEIFTSQDCILGQTCITLHCGWIRQANRHENNDLFLNLFTALPAEEILSDQRNLAKIRDATINGFFLRFRQTTNDCGIPIVHGEGRVNALHFNNRVSRKGDTLVRRDLIVFNLGADRRLNDHGNKTGGADARGYLERDTITEEGLAHKEFILARDHLQFSRNVQLILVDTGTRGTDRQIGLLDSHINGGLLLIGHDHTRIGEDSNIIQLVKSV